MESSKLIERRHLLSSSPWRAQFCLPPSAPSAESIFLPHPLDSPFFLSTPQPRHTTLAFVHSHRASTLLGTLFALTRSSCSSLPIPNLSSVHLPPQSVSTLAYSPFHTPVVPLARQFCTRASLVPGAQHPPTRLRAFSLTRTLRLKNSPEPSTKSKDQLGSEGNKRQWPGFWQGAQPSSERE